MAEVRGLCLLCRRDDIKSVAKQLEKATAEGNTALAGLYMVQWRALLAQQTQLLRDAAGEPRSPAPPASLTHTQCRNACTLAVGRRVVHSLA